MGVLGSAKECNLSYVALVRKTNYYRSMQILIIVTLTLVVSAHLCSRVMMDKVLLMIFV